MKNSESKYYNTALLMDEALLYLLEKKEFEYITVKEICEKAGVNRSTFYLHYETINDLLIETIQMISKRFYNNFNNKNLNVNKLDKKDLFFINDEYLIPYLTFIKENKRIYKLIHNNPILFQKEQTTNIFYNTLFSKILTKFNVKEEDKEYIFSYFSFGLVAIISKWVEKDCIDDINKISKLMKEVIGYSQ